MAKMNIEEVARFYFENNCSLPKTREFTKKYKDGGFDETTISARIRKYIISFPEFESLMLKDKNPDNLTEFKSQASTILEFLIKKEAMKAKGKAITKKYKRMQHMNDLDKFDKVQQEIDKDIKPHQNVINNYFFQIGELRKPYSEEQYIPPEVKKEIKNLENKKDHEQKIVDAKIGLKARQAPKPMFILGICIFLEILCFFWAVSQGIGGIIAFFVTLIILFVFTASKPMKHRFWFLVERFFTKIAEIFYNWINGIAATIDEIEEKEKKRK